MPRRKFCEIRNSSYTNGIRLEMGCSIMQYIIFPTVLFVFHIASLNVAVMKCKLAKFPSSGFNRICETVCGLRGKFNL
jgi:hypothetical protein